MALSIFILLWKFHHQSSPKFFSSSQTETLYPLNNKSPILSGPGNHYSTFCLYELDYSRNHKIIVLLYLASYIQHTVFTVLPCWIMYQNFILLRLNNMPLNVSITFYNPYIHWWPFGLFLPFDYDDATKNIGVLLRYFAWNLKRNSSHYYKHFPMWLSEHPLNGLHSLSFKFINFEL